MKERRFFEDVYTACQSDKKRIVFPEATDERVIQAVNTLASRDILKPVLLVSDETPEGLHDDVIVDEVDPDETLLSSYQSARDVSRDEAYDALQDPITYSMMLARVGRSDGVVCGANHPSKMTYSHALKLVGPRSDVDVVSTAFLLFWNDEQYLFADCALNIDPDAETLAHIAQETVHTAHSLDMTARVAMLSYSTRGSGAGPSPTRVEKATELVRERCRCNVLGEVQFDAAFKKSVREVKLGEPGEPCNVYVFPSLDAANIGYKIADHMGGASAIGPLTQGLAASVNDLSRGCDVQEIVETAALTARGLNG